jgi:tetratricopeptide (TPR) repeat protein
VGGAAWILDETELAVRVLRGALSKMREPGVGGASGGVLSGLEWACVDSGRWDDALATAREASEIAAAYKMGTVTALADLTTATVSAMRGDHDRVAPLLGRVVAAVEISEYRGFAVRDRHAAGLAALAQGDYVIAYAQLSQVYDADGTPLHNRFSYLAIADLAAAVRAERHLEARTLVERALARLDPAPGPRGRRGCSDDLDRGTRQGKRHGNDDGYAGAAPPAGSVWGHEFLQREFCKALSKQHSRKPAHRRP